MNERAFLESLPQKRMAAGALFFDTAGNLLVVKPVYKDTWGIPGGMVERGESPRQACIREVREELGLACRLERLLCVDYTSDTAERTESLQFIFLGGTLSKDDIGNIRLPAAELCEFRFLEPEHALPLLDERLSRRIAQCLKRLANQRTLYLEDQELSLKLPIVLQE
jgi:ADP-ribose pyrophosphatase YjhB (NUDIX family)